MKFFDHDTFIMHSGDDMDGYARCGVNVEAMTVSSLFDDAHPTTCIICAARERAEPARIRPGGFDFQGGLKEW